MVTPSAPTPRRAWISLGANLGDGLATLRAARRAIAALDGVTSVRASSVWRSAPIDSDGPTYWNAVVEATTTLEPEALLAALQRIELDHGRERPYRNAPRTLDLDLLLLDDAVRATPTLTLPHPRLHERAFVVEPLLELAPTLVVPGVGALAGRRAAVAHQALERVEGASLE